MRFIINVKFLMFFVKLLFSHCIKKVILVKFKISGVSVFCLVYINFLHSCFYFECVYGLIEIIYCMRLKLVFVEIILQLIIFLFYPLLLKYISLDLRER